MTDVQTVESRAFYRDRRLEIPGGEVRPETPKQVRDAIGDLRGDGRRWRLIGDGQHVEGAGPEGDEYVAVRTEELSGIVDLDRQSAIARVWAGTRWRDLRDSLRDEGLTVQRYGLHPASATVGGMLARRRVGPVMLRGGELLDGCIALGAWNPEGGDYRYLVAPRKASGPDLRYEFAGAGDSGGAIIDAAFEVWRPVERRLFRYEGRRFAEAASVAAGLFDAGITPCWMHYGYPSGVLQFALAMPQKLLGVRRQWIADEFGAPDEILENDDADTRRDWLEARHPDRRAHPEAENTRVLWVAPAALDGEPEDVFGDGLESLEAIRWTPRRAEVYARYDGEADVRCDEAVWATRRLCHD